MKVLAWHVRSTNKVFKQKKVKNFIQNEVGLIAILENKVKQQHAGIMINKIAPGWS